MHILFNYVNTLTDPTNYDLFGVSRNIPDDVYGRRDQSVRIAVVEISFKA